jgi:HEAT repeat protein
MKLPLRIATILLGLFSTACVRTGAALPAATMPTSELPPEVTTAAQREDYYAARLTAVLPALSGADLGARQKAEQAFQASCWLAARPGAEVERLAVSTAAAKALGGDLASSARLFLLRQLAFVGRDESVAPLAALLDHPEADTRDAARRALAANPVAAAGAALSRRLEQSGDETERLALLQALLYRREATAAPLFRAAAVAGPDAIRALAFEGLAAVGGAADAELLQPALANGPETLRRAAADACLRLADRLCDQGERPAALALYRALLSAPPPARHAALIGIGRAGSAADLPDLITGLGDADAETRGAARAALALLPPEEVVPAVTAALQTASSQLRQALLQALAESRVAGVRPALTAALAETDEGMRLIAIAGLGLLADPQSALPLAQVVASARGTTLEAARNALALIPGEAVAAALIAAFPAAPPAGRRALLVTLVTRRGERTVSFLCQVAASDAEAPVREEALRGLARLAGEEHIPSLLPLLLRATTDAEREEAAKAIAAAARRSGDLERAAATVVSGLQDASPADRGLLLRALGRIGGERALAAVRTGLADPAPTLRDAAVRALADWPDTAAADELLNLVKTAPELVHRVLALRAYVRVVREAGTLTPAEKLARLTAAMAAVPRPEDRKLVLAGLGDCADPGALPVALACLDQADVAAEAAAALNGLADRLRWQYPRECQAALLAVAAKAPAEPERKRAAELQAEIRRYEGYLTLWLLAGPYAQEKKSRADLHGIAFPPEPAAPTEPVAWEPARPAAAPDRSWYVPLDEAIGGYQCVAYLRTWVRSATAQKVRLEIGTDDGCKAWLNGSLVVDQNVDRALAPAQDTPEVALNSGWNCLLLKVSQGGGFWSAAARFRTPEDQPLDGLVTLASPAAFALAAADVSQDPANPAALAAAADLVLAAAGTPAQRRTVLTQLVAAKNDTVARAAQESLLQLEAGEDYLTRWQMAGPYEHAGTDGAGLLDVAFPPEAQGAQGVAWLPAAVAAGPDGIPFVDLVKLLGGDHRAAYLRARVTSPTAQPVRLELGSDDGVKVWLNGRLVHANNAARPVRPGEDKVAAELKQGENTVLLKVTQGQGGWGACLRFRTPDGRHLDGVAELAP